MNAARSPRSPERPSRRRRPLPRLPLLLPVAALLWPAGAGALPIFARRYNVPCVTCHSAPPYLNKTGRRFKEAGYRLADEEGNIDDDAQNLNKVMPFLYLEKTPPIAGRIIARPVLVKREAGKTEPALVGLNELEILIAGNVHPMVSFFGELEAEDEEKFGLSGEGRVGFHPWRLLNVSFGWGSPFAADPYNSLKDGGHRLTIANKAGLSYRNVTGAAINKPAQFVTVYGRAGMLYYSAGYTGNTGDAEGEDPVNATARLALDVGEAFAAGLFGWFGFSREVDKPKLDAAFQRFGLDLNLDAGDFHAVGLFMVDLVQASPVGGGPESRTADLAGYAEFFYTMRFDNRLLFMPLVRFDYTSMNDRGDHLLSVAANVSSYVFSNVRLGIEVDADLVIPEKAARGWRVGLLADIVL